MRGATDDAETYKIDPEFLLTRLLRGATYKWSKIEGEDGRFLLTRLLRGATWAAPTR